MTKNQRKMHKSPFVVPTDDEATAARLAALGPVCVAGRHHHQRMWFSVESIATGRIVGDDLTEREAKALADRINLACRVRKGRRAGA